MKPQKRRGWVSLAFTAWLVLAGYAALSFFLVARYQPNVALDQVSPERVNSDYGSLGAQLYEHLTPIWRYNKYVGSLMLLLALGLTLMAFHDSRKSRGVAA